MGKVDDNRVVLLFDVLDGEIRGVDFVSSGSVRKNSSCGVSGWLALLSFTTTVEFASSNDRAILSLLSA
jgi:hypothetical protein